MRELLAWHSQVFTVTRPSLQWAKRLNWMAANAFCVSRKVDAHTRAMNHFFMKFSQCLNAPACAWICPLQCDQPIAGNHKKKGPLDRAMAKRRFLPPWSVEDIDAAFVVKDGSGQKVAYVY